MSSTTTLLARPGDPPSNPASRLWWALPSVGILLLTLLSVLFGGGPDKVDFGTSYDASSSGSRAAFLLLEELGYPVERSRRPPGGDVRWILFPTKTVQKEATALDDWIRRGGVVLLALDDAEFATHLGLAVTVVGGHPLDRFSRFDGFGGPTPFTRAKGTTHTAEAPDVKTLLAGDTEVTGPPDGRTWGLVEDEPLLTIYSRGQGEIWLLHRPDVLTNANLRGDDNAILTCRLADAMLARRPGGRLAFDEYCHGLRDRPTAIDLLFHPPLLGVTLQVLLLAALALWHFGSRFGPIRTVPPPPRRSKEEFLEALADLLARNGDRAEAFVTIRDDFRLRLEASLGLPVGTPLDQTAREAGRRRGVSAEALLRLLTAPAPPDGSGAVAFLTALNQLETLAHECFPRQRTR
jgi:hypothetical protein